LRIGEDQVCPYLKKTPCYEMFVTQDLRHADTCEHGNEASGSINRQGISDKLGDYCHVTRTLLQGVG